MNDKLKEIIHLNEKHIGDATDAKIGSVVISIDPDTGVLHYGANVSKEASIILMEQAIKPIKTATSANKN